MVNNRIANGSHLTPPSMCSWNSIGWLENHHTPSFSRRVRKFDAREGVFHRHFLAKSRARREVSSLRARPSPRPRTSQEEQK